MANESNLVTESRRVVPAAVRIIEREYPEVFAKLCQGEEPVLMLLERFPHPESKAYTLAMLVLVDLERRQNRIEGDVIAKLKNYDVKVWVGPSQVEEVAAKLEMMAGAEYVYALIAAESFLAAQREIALRIKLAGYSGFHPEDVIPVWEGR